MIHKRIGEFTTALYSQTDGGYIINFLDGRASKVTLGQDHDLTCSTANKNDALTWHSLQKLYSNNTTLKIGCLLDKADYLADYSVEQLENYFQILFDSNKYEKLFVHLWADSEQGLANIPESINLIQAASNFYSKELSICFHLNPTLDINNQDLSCLEKLPLRYNANQVVFTISQESINQAPDLVQYLLGLVQKQSLFYHLGFSPQYIFRFTMDSLDYLLSRVFRELCFSGIYPRNIYFSCHESGFTEQQACCELYGFDWTCWHGVITQIHQNPMYQLIEPMNIGFGNKVYSLLAAGSEDPIFSYCPFRCNTYIFGAEGNICSCPVAAGDAEKYSGLYYGNLPEKKYYRIIHSKWYDRGPTTIEKCTSCAYSPFCGSSCALLSFEKSGDLLLPQCPPAEHLIEKVIKLKNGV